MDSIQNPLFYSCDIETLGTDTLSPIIEIGITAVYKNEDKNLLSLKTESCVVSIQQHLWQTSNVLKTVQYHLRQPAGSQLVSEAIKGTLVYPERTLLPAFTKLIAEFGITTLPSAGGQPISRAPWYFRGPQFDAKMLEVQLGLLGVGMPWRYSCVRCQRTLDHINPDPTDPTAVSHRAGDDAKAQADRIIQCMIAMHGDEINDWLL